MATVASYHRPAAIDDALALLARPDAVALAGGTKINAAPTPTPVALVDLQALGLGRVEASGGGTVRIGAMATLQEVADARNLPASVREAARREQPSTLRTSATAGGCAATRDPASEFLAALLVHEAVVHLAGLDGDSAVPLADVLSTGGPPPGHLVTGITLAITGVSAAARVGRTPADRPIVAAVARRTDDGRHRLALTGVAATPVLVTDLDALDPPSDFRGSSAYRRRLAAVLSARVLEAVS
jgi:probable selenate reductase FAD-binding subunit